MNRHDYTDRFLEHYESPRHYGPLVEADVVLQGGNPDCGDIITIYLTVAADETAEKIQFEGEGCTISQAATSILLELTQGKPLAEIEAIDYNALIDTLGREVVLGRVRCATLSLNILKKAIQQYRAHQIKDDKKKSKVAQ